MRGAHHERITQQFRAKLCAALIVFLAPTTLVFHSYRRADAARLVNQAPRIPDAHAGRRGEHRIGGDIDPQRMRTVIGLVRGRLPASVTP
ncbi:MAG: hypothetical protein ACM3SS_18660 [Rhodospirillaceae bacterium]